MALSPKQTALLHVAKKHLGMEDDDYRAMLQDVAGVTSSRDLDGYDFAAVLQRLRALGFRHEGGARDLGERKGMASGAQIAFIRSLWNEYTEGEGDDRSLGKWLERTFKLSDIRFIRYGEAGRVITALKAMAERKGG